MKLLVLQLDDHKADSSGDIMPTNAMISFPDFIPLFLDFDHQKTIGSAKLFREGSKFFISELQGNDGVDLTNLTPAISGKIINKSDKTIDVFTIDTVSFQTNGNADKSIKTVGEQLKEDK